MDRGLSQARDSVAVSDSFNVPGRVPGIDDGILKIEGSVQLAAGSLNFFAAGTRGRSLS